MSAKCFSIGLGIVRVVQVDEVGMLWPNLTKSSRNFIKNIHTANILENKLQTLKFKNKNAENGDPKSTFPPLKLFVQGYENIQ